MVRAKDLIDFEQKIADLYTQGKIKSPVHLETSIDGSLEEELIRLFKSYEANDWIITTHRSHYFWLLSGRSSEELEKQILENHSMSIMSSRFISTSIVAGGGPIAVGIAWALKMQKSKNKVWCIMGDAAYECGITYESIKYAERHDLPIIFIILDNHLCVRANTKNAWGLKDTKKVIKIEYERKFNHAGSGLNGESKYVMF